MQSKPALTLCALWCLLTAWSRDAEAQLGNMVTEATPGNYVHSVITTSCTDPKTGSKNFTQIRVGYRRVVWNSDGRAIELGGLEPTIQNLVGGNLKVVSALDRPNLKDSVLSVTVEGLGELKINLRNGGQSTMDNAAACKLFPTPRAKSP